MQLSRPLIDAELRRRFVAAGEGGDTATTPDNEPPTVSLTGPAPGATVSGTVNLTATASDNVGVEGVQFLVDGAETTLGAEDTTRDPHLGLRRVVGHHHGPKRQLHADRSCPRRRRQHRHLHAGERLRRQRRYHGTRGERHRSPAGTVSGTVTVTATASDNVGVEGVQFLVDNGAETKALGAEDTAGTPSPWPTACRGTLPRSKTAATR